MSQKTDNNDPVRSIITTQLPSTETEFRQIYLRGTHAIVPNLPQPEVTSIEEHSHVSIKQCVSDFSGKGYFPDVIPNISSSNQKKIQ